MSFKFQCLYSEGENPKKADPAEVALSTDGENRGEQGRTRGKQENRLMVLVWYLVLGPIGPFIKV